MSCVFPVVIKDTGTDLVFMLDSNVNEQIFGWMKTFVKRFAGQVDIDNGTYRVGSMTFESRPSVGFHLNRYNFQDEVLLVHLVMCTFLHTKNYM